MANAAATLSVRERYKNFNTNKQEMIDFLYTQLDAPKSFTDLGAVWNVDGAYTFYTLDTYEIEKAVLVDQHVLDPVWERAKLHPQLTCLPRMFGEQATKDAVGDVEAVYLFDVLLHQVNPNWDLVLDRYAPNTKYFVIYNQQFLGTKKTVRLFDLGEDEYFKNVPHDRGEVPYTDLFDKLDTYPEGSDRPWRDLHCIWQWGITDADLIKKFASMGYECKFSKNYGMFCNLENFEDHGFIFEKVR